ncbi:MAG TPA: hypothetical protein VGO22_20900 [Pseudorhizobium sp.]|nr:hypothetical protein [Pseudorhizobium sp.]
MVSEIAAWLFALFVVDPIHAEVRERVERANLPAQAVQQSRQCLSTYGPKLLEQAGEDPAWAVSTAIGITIGWTSPVQLLDIDDPNCAVLAGLLVDQPLRTQKVSQWLVTGAARDAQAASPLRH